MSFYDVLDIEQYRFGWAETHPNETLDDETIVDCLRDEHDALINALVADDLASPSDLFERILREGFEGYEEMKLRDLWQEVNDRGLTI